ncbi:MAG TPA: sugar transferase, partial [Gemmatimonadaceae bacterium]|nr:sugar transferase [Gemmatimonadaceae bacterium]
MTSLNLEAEAPASRRPWSRQHPSVRSVVKRAFDLGFAAVAIALSLPLFVLLGIAVRLTSPGPVLFRQRRVGLNGRPFVMLKFRSMHFGASEAQHREYVTSMISSASRAGNRAGAYKLANDCRITAVGAFLRRTSLDEL